MPTDFDEEQVDYTGLLTKSIADIRYINQTGDKMEGDLNMDSHKITNATIESSKVFVEAPVGAKDAANKEYVDQCIQKVTLPKRPVNSANVPPVILPFRSSKQSSAGNSKMVFLTFDLSSIKLINSEGNEVPVDNLDYVYVTASILLEEWGRLAVIKGIRKNFENRNFEVRFAIENDSVRTVGGIRNIIVEGALILSAIGINQQERPQSDEPAVSQSDQPFVNE